MRPPAALVGSDDVLFWEEFRRDKACDGPACDQSAQYMYSINSSTFKGVVKFNAVPTTQPVGWNISIDQQELNVLPGDQIFVHLIMDCYQNPMVGADPMVLAVRITARAFPADGSPSFVIGTHVATAHCVISSLRFANQSNTIYANTNGVAESTEVVLGTAIDSPKFGGVKIYADQVPPGWQVTVDQPLVWFTGNGQVPLAVRVRAPVGYASTSNVRLVALLNHPSFAEPMISSIILTVVI